MNALLAAAGGIAVISTIAVILQRKAVHALLYLIVSFFALAVSMLALGAAFAAALEVLVYAGAIMVLFVFVVMMIGTEGRSPGGRAWIGPAILAALLLGELAFALSTGMAAPEAGGAFAEVAPKAVGRALFGPYALCVEIAAFLLLAGLVGAYRLGRRGPKPKGGAR